MQRDGIIGRCQRPERVNGPQRTMPLTPIRPPRAAEAPGSGPTAADGKLRVRGLGTGPNNCTGRGGSMRPGGAVRTHGCSRSFCQRRITHGFVHRFPALPCHPFIDNASEPHPGTATDLPGWLRGRRRRGRRRQVAALQRHGHTARAAVAAAGVVSGPQKLLPQPQPNGKGKGGEGMGVVRCCGTAVHKDTPLQRRPF